MIPSLEANQSAASSLLKLEEFDSKVGSISDIIAQLKKTYEQVGEHSEEKADKLKHMAQNISGLIGVFDTMVATHSKERAGKSEEDNENQAQEGILTESISDIKQNFKLMEDRFISLSKVAGDAPAAGSSQTAAYDLIK